ncbi:stage II sporulation protein M [Rufibacter ruber]|uniref:stage II sporulation protein M n=1 Tax=Rufibacter ruber TaxID=1783499 RepID=UPI00082CF2A6|nr:stage II sporulation protein M [Rufibacter ruber]
MREAAFVKQNSAKWKRYAAEPTTNPDELADRFIELTDDLAFARTFYPDSDTTHYLNSLTGKMHQAIYRNKKEQGNRFFLFWKQELPLLFRQHHRQLLYAFLIFAVACLIGALSAAYDDSFVRLIMGDRYVNMTIANIRKGDPMAVYKQAGEAEMFLQITMNNVYVSFLAFVAGAVLSVGTFYVLFRNGVMLGAFQYFFYKYGLLGTSALTIWIHGTLEISAIVIAGCAGFVMGNSILFPKTFSRLESFKRGAKQGLKIVVGLVPVFITAGFLEGFVTRHTEMPLFLSLTIILGSAAFIVYYFIYYPYRLHAKLENDTTHHRI